MARVVNNVFLNGVSGTISKQMTVVNRRDLTVIRRSRRANKDAKPTPRQVDAQDKFTEASDYARRMMEDPDMKALYASYAAAGKNAYNMALKDAYNPPVIQHISVVNYQGGPGDTIVVRAVDQFRVYQVSVAIYSADGVQLEAGLAFQGRNGKDWTYTAVGNNPAEMGVRIVATAEDVPGNKTISEISAL